MGEEEEEVSIKQSKFFLESPFVQQKQSRRVYADALSSRRGRLIISGDEEAVRELKGRVKLSAPTGLTLARGNYTRVYEITAIPGAHGKPLLPGRALLGHFETGLLILRGLALGRSQSRPRQPTRSCACGSWEVGGRATTELRRFWLAAGAEFLEFLRRRFVSSCFSFILPMIFPLFLD